jgi:hypothetical protein
MLLQNVGSNKTHISEDGILQVTAAKTSDLAYEELFPNLSVHTCT